MGTKLKIAIGKLWRARRGSFDDEHKLAHIKKDLRTQDSEVKIFFRDYYVFETKIVKPESLK